MNQPVRTDSCTSTSSGDVDSSSGDSATSGFSSAGSDVTKATGSTDENETMTLGRAAKRQKPAIKPKRELNRLLFCCSNVVFRSVFGSVSEQDLTAECNVVT